MERGSSMNSIKKILIAVSLVVIVSAFVPAVKAMGLDEANWPTRITFAMPVQIGEMVLGPGSYEFQLTPGTVDRGVVMIYNVDSGRWLGMVMGINVNRVDTPKMSGFTYKDMGMGAPKAVEYWFYSGWNRGIKFLYPHTRTTDIMAAAITPSIN
jgi:hypothetical protein